MSDKKPVRPRRRPSSDGTSSTGPKYSGKVIIETTKGTKRARVEYFQRRPSKPVKKK